MKERLHKYMARCGVASRRKCEELIFSGKVRVNGEIVREPGTKIDPGVDRVEVEGRLVSEPEESIYIMLNKPPGYITSAEDSFNRPTVFELVKDVRKRVFSVGRLDLNSRGLLLLTNDGELAYRLTHPRYKVEKEYIVKINGVPTARELRQLEEGVELEGGYRTQQAQLKVLDRTNNTATVSVVISEGRKRQVKRMFSAIGYRVMDLRRIRIGDIHLGKLPEGRWRYLRKGEIKKLKTSVGLDLPSEKGTHKNTFEFNEAQEQNNGTPEKITKRN
ncbi:rRNA pseudouridine synthase [Candidatus Sumerlaeota bacterium]|nr:rRNA pseudouridine synthase [Candidatus Sumerlaeota bacterium]